MSILFLKRYRVCVYLPNRQQTCFVPGKGKEIFLVHKTPRPILGTTQTFIQWEPRFFPGGQAAKAWSWTHSSI
jgi:hypothetical protein